jgi:hypothetical protein
MKALHQGGLDATCGLYAVVNSVRVAASRDLTLTQRDCSALYFSLVEAADDCLNGMGALVREGTSATEVRILLRKANRWLISEKGFRLVWAKPYKTNQRPRARTFLTMLQGHLHKGGSAILWVSSDEEHWTTLRSLASKSLVLLDSDGLTRLPTGCVRGSSKGTRSRYTIDPVDTFLISTRRL